MEARDYQQIVLIVLALTYLSHRINVKFGAALATSFFYVALACVANIFTFNYSPTYLEANLRDRAIISASQVLITLILLGVGAIAIKRDHWRLILGCVWIFCVIDALMLIFHQPGMMDAYSFNSGVLAIFFPFYLFSPHRMNWVPTWITFALCVLVGGRTATGIIMFSGVVFLIRHRAWLWLWSSVIGSSIVVVNKWEHFSKYSDRASLILNWCEFWKANVDHTFGSGPGSFEWIAPFLPSTGKLPLFTMAHNDFFQAMFELGLVGLSYLLWLTVATLWKARKNFQHWTTVVAIIFLMSVYFPLHYPMSVLAIAGFVIIIWSKDKSVSY